MEVNNNNDQFVLARQGGGEEKRLVYLEADNLIGKKFKNLKNHGACLIFGTF